MSYSKKYYGGVLALSLLACHPSSLKAQEQEFSDATFLIVAGVLVAVPALAYWYQNYYKVDTTTPTALIKEFNGVVQETMELLDLISYGDEESINHRVSQRYPNAPIVHSFVEELQTKRDRLIYLKNAFKRKNHFKQIPKKEVIEQVDEFVKFIDEIIEKCEKSDRFKEEESIESNSYTYSDYIDQNPYRNPHYGPTDSYL